MRVLVTGSASRLAAALLPRLLEDRRIGEVVGVDLQPTPIRHQRLASAIADIRDPKLGERVGRVDAVIHLAFVVPGSELAHQGRELARDINVHGTANVAGMAATCGAARFVHLSSVAVYALPARGPRIREEDPRGALPGFHYAEDKIAVEDWLDVFEAQHPHLNVVRLRPHVILGPHCQPLLRWMLRAPVYPWLPRPLPLLQCVHEDDVADAIRSSLFADARGAFNLAADPALPFRALQEVKRRAACPLPFTLVRALARGALRVRGSTEEPAWLEGLRHSIVVDTSRSRELLDWRPRFSAVDACRAS